MKTLKYRKYNQIYKKIRKQILAQNPVCHYCKTAPADTVDHVPPIDSFPAPELWVGTLLPACGNCNYSRGAKYGNDKRKRKDPKNSRNW